MADDKRCETCRHEADAKHPMRRYCTVPLQPPLPAWLRDKQHGALRIVSIYEGSDCPCWQPKEDEHGPEYVPIPEHIQTRVRNILHGEQPKEDSR